MRQIELFTRIQIFFISGFLYMGMEVFFHAILGLMIGFKGSSYWSFMGFSSLWMIVIGGACITISAHIHDRSKANPRWNLLFSLLSVWLMEFVCGCILNLLFGLNLWSYKDLPLNLLGQVTLVYTPIWCLLIPFGWWLIDALYYISDYDTITPKPLRYYYWSIITGKQI